MAIDFEKMDGLVPAIIQHHKTREVLMLGFMNREAHEKTLSEGKVCFYSRTKDRLWTKGEESGNFLHLVDIKEDCDRDTLLVRVDPAGPVCHTGSRTCFGDEKEQDADSPPAADIGFLLKLQDLLQSRKAELPENSYTTKLFKSGVNRIAKKLGEEAVELVIEAKDSNDELFLNEAADLLFHMMILLTERGYKLEDVSSILAQRHKK